MSTCYPSSIVCIDIMEVNKGEFMLSQVIYMYFVMIIVGVVLFISMILIILIIIVASVATIKMKKKTWKFAEG